MIPTAPADSAPPEPTPPGSVQALCPAWKRGHCTGVGRCQRQHPRPTAYNRALPVVGQAATHAALGYGMAQGWIQDETARGSVNIQEAVNRVAHTGQTEVALHNRGRHGGPMEGLIMEPTGMMRRVRPQWTIQM